jgi:anti-sigma B factor antagonist
LSDPHFPAREFLPCSRFPCTILFHQDLVPTVTNTNFSATIRQTGAVSLVDLSGHLTCFEIGVLRDAISRLLKQGRKNMVLNLSRLHYLDSSGIGELAREYVTVVKQGGQMKVVGLSSRVEDILKITQLYQLFPEFPNEEAALESFTESSGQGIVEKHQT